ncbi:MAG: macrolide ABC transporter permease [Bacteroidetes bacterium]|nr:MAG: macrolide ABC transporter permease [Bacteroidota bacterium]
MLRNYLRTALRNLRNRKSFSLINIFGLTSGLSATLLIALFVWDEHQYDKFISGGDQVYRIYNKVTRAQGADDVSVTPPVFTGILQREFPSVQQTARVMELPENKQLFEADGRQLYEQSGFYVDSTFFEVFPLNFEYGSPSKALDGPSSIVISKALAARLFGSGDPVGRKIVIEKQPVLVKGVFEKNPKFHLQFDFLRPLSAIPIPAERMQSWQWQQFYSYVRLKKGSDVNAAEANFQKIIKERAQLKTRPGGFIYLPFFQPLQGIHLYSASFKFDEAQRGNITYVRTLIIIAVFILIIACFNFINLSTAMSMRRAKEVGVRKTIGASKKQLIFQFMGETMTLAFFCTLLAIILTSFLIPWLNHFTNKDISIFAFINPRALSLAVLLIGVVGLVAGTYPAIVLSGFDPVKVLKAGTFKDRSPGKISWLRQGLVIVQFSLSILLIISAIIVFRQVEYLHNKELGFDKEQIMFFQMRGDNMSKNVDAFKNELMQTAGVSKVSIGYGFPGDAVAGDEIIVDRNGRKETQSATQLAVDFDYIKTLGLEIVAGRDFSKEMATDQDHAWIINQTAVRDLGFGTPQNALGKTLSWHPWDGNNPDSLKIGKIIGVVKDFNYKSLYDKIEPAVLQIYPLAAWKVAVKLNTASISNTIAQVTTVWNKFSPEYPIEYKFLDENFERMYRSEDKLSSLLWIFTGVAIFVGCLGLFGLAAYTAEARIKEVSIRKILGASAKGMVLLLSKDFIRPIIISIFIASPTSWYFMNQWLQGFAYRQRIAWWIFLLAGLSAILIAILTVSYQAFRAARANPVKRLRSE